MVGDRAGAMLGVMDEARHDGVYRRIISGKVPANRMETLFPWAWKAERGGIADQERRAA